MTGNVLWVLYVLTHLILTVLGVTIIPFYLWGNQVTERLSTISEAVVEPVFEPVQSDSKSSHFCPFRSETSLLDMGWLGHVWSLVLGVECKVKARARSAFCAPGITVTTGDCWFVLHRLCPINKQKYILSAEKCFRKVHSWVLAGIVSWVQGSTIPTGTPSALFDSRRDGIVCISSFKF